jgi:hypothetical protein
MYGTYVSCIFTLGPLLSCIFEDVAAPPCNLYICVPMHLSIHHASHPLSTLSSHLEPTGRATLLLSCLVSQNGMNGLNIILPPF